MKVQVHGRYHGTKRTDVTGVGRYGRVLITGTVDFPRRAKRAGTDDGRFIDGDDIPS